MKISFDLPDSFISVVDTTNYKGVPVTVLYVMGQQAAYFISRDSHLDSEGWEDIIKYRIAKFFGEMISKQYAEEWSTDNPTGREIDYEPEINFVREDEN